MRGEWLHHPESPGIRVFVVRTWLGWFLKPRYFATYQEVQEHYLRIRAARVQSPPGGRWL